VTAAADWLARALSQSKELEERTGGGHAPTL
jgi:hypothetical protein